ncbi:class I SAM-dependent RNA methyltransferase [Ghiorsea bivora]|uniref:class I SAM-dependent RNA methyltransferase n=1 Tax=Ghiorsea bivora TaxID=1485545 RepID=UPI00056F0A58|nr:methyltransferase [Ghiorsea bivora]
MSEQYTATVEAILPGGEGLVRERNHTVLIPNTVVGDRIQFQYTEKKRGVFRGEIKHIITPSSQRVQAKCSVANTCGGCALQHLSQPTQAELKNKWVTDAFQAFIDKHSTVISCSPQPNNSGFAGRRRVRWFMDNGKLGFRKRFSHHIVHSDSCMAITQDLDTLRKQLETSQLPQSIQSIQAVALSNGTHIILESEQSCPTDFTPPKQDNQQWWWSKLGTPSIQALHKPVQTLFDTIQITENKSINIQIGPNDFIQGHAKGNQILIQQILDWSKDAKRVVDLFSGCGNLSLPLAAATGIEVVGAELNPASVKAANNNAKRLGLNASYQTLDLFGVFSTEPFINADILILDPPRKGAKRICQQIGQLFPKKIIMVNCDIAAGARDAKALADAGFKLKALRPLDLFPYTGHVEALSLWEA